MSEKSGVVGTLKKEDATGSPACVSVAFGDGIGPEIMEASLKVLMAAGARLEIEPVELGERVYLAGHSAGIEQQTWDSLRRTKVFYKGPITTPQGGGFKSLNVTVRKSLGLFANVRPCVAYAPAIESRHPRMDVVIVRENEEDLYAVLEADLPAGLRADRSLRLRLCPSERQAEGHMLHQRQYHEAHRRPFP